MYVNVILTDKPHWGAWKEWSVCTRSCGTGRSFRERMCVPAKCPDPYHRKCEGNSHEKRKCNEQCCPGMLVITKKLKIFLWILIINIFDLSHMNNENYMYVLKILIDQKHIKSTYPFFMIPLIKIFFESEYNFINDCYGKIL